MFVNNTYKSIHSLQTPYDVTAVFTSVPVYGALEVAKELLESDDGWKKWTYLNAKEILSLIKFV